jgi:hypothetical protein
MEAESQRPKEHEGTISTLNTAIEALNLAKELSSITPAKAVFGSVSVILTMIRVGFLLVFVGRLQTEMHPTGRDDQPGRLHRAWDGLC